VRFFVSPVKAEPRDGNRQVRLLGSAKRVAENRTLRRARFVAAGDSPRLKVLGAR
jgi:hypothetical protein